MDYYSKETLMATHSSFILPKESPLVVRKKSRKIKRAPSKLSTSRLHTGHIFYYYNVAQGYRNFEQAEARCHESTDSHPRCKSATQTTLESLAIGHRYDNPPRRSQHCTCSVPLGDLLKQEE